MTPPLPSWNTVLMPTDTQPQPSIAQPISESSTLSNPSKTKPRNLWKILVIFFAIITIITASAVGIFIFSQFNSNIKTENNKKSSQNSPLDNPLILKMAEKLPIPKITFIPITLTPTSPASPTNLTQTPNLSPLAQSQIPPGIWKTYKNSSFNFSLNYPAELTVQEKSHDLGIADISFSNPNGNPQNGPKYQILIYPKIIGNLIGQNFDQLYALAPQDTLLMTSESSTPQQFTKINNNTINSLRAFKFRATSDPPDPAEEAEIGAYIELGENTLIISTGESNQTILDYMLSTFKSPL